MRPSVLTAMLPSRGKRSGGSSRTKSLVRPGITAEASRPIRMMTERITRAHRTKAAGWSGPSSASTTVSWAEHGTPRARSRMTIIRSLRVSRIRVVRVAMVSQPRPSTMGRTALPLSPMRRKSPSTMTASRGRYPESSSAPKAMKKVPTIGSTRARE